MHRHEGAHVSIAKAGQPITSLADWLQLAPPRSHDQWVDGRSAKEVARAWLEENGVKLPREVDAALTAHPMFGPVIAWEAEPEARLPFDKFAGETRNSDLAVIVQDSSGSYVLAVEAKADEPFGETVGETFAAALETRIGNPRSNGLARIEFLATQQLKPRIGCAAKATDLRYQLLTACAGAVVEAHRRNLARAVMLIHEFVTSATLDSKNERNATDLAQFLGRVAENGPESVEDGKLYGPFEQASVRGVQLFVGKVKRNLRLVNADPSACPR
jgi:hypothetical protein